MTRPFWIYSPSLSPSLIDSIKKDLPIEMERMKTMRRDIAGCLKFGTFETVLTFDKAFEMGYLASFYRSKEEIASTERGRDEKAD